MIVKRINIDPIELTAKDVAEIFTDGDSLRQAKILGAITSQIEAWTSPWANQCRSIANEMNTAQKKRVGAILRTLLEHIEE